MTTPTKYISFLIRLWREGGSELPEPPTDWSSEIEHIQSGRRWTFTTLEETLGFLHRQADGREVLDLPLDE